MEKIWVGLFLIVLGSWYVLSPKSVLAMRVKFARLFGMKITGSKKTLTTFRYAGGVLVLFGLYLLLVY